MQNEEDQGKNTPSTGAKVMRCEKAENLAKIRNAVASARGALHSVLGLVEQTDVVFQHHADLEITYMKIHQEIQQHASECESCTTK
jgi:hypothetical protein